jgi:hypothetical protein
MIQRINPLILNSDIREVVADYLFGADFTQEQLKSIAIFADGRWYKYPQWGTYRINMFNRIIVRLKTSP